MKKAYVFPLALATVLTTVPCWAADAAPAATTAPASHYSTADTPLGDLLDDPAAKAVLMKYVPDLIGNDQIDMARGMTLRALQSYAGDQLTDAKLASIDADLAKLPAK